MRMEDVLPSRGIENATPDIPLGRDPLEIICAAVNTHRLSFASSSKGLKLSNTQVFFIH